MDPLTRMADQLRAEKERLTNELANIRGESEVQNSALDNMARKLTEAENALIAQYDAIVVAVKGLKIGDDLLGDFDSTIDEALDAIAKHDPRMNNKGE